MRLWYNYNIKEFLWQKKALTKRAFEKIGENNICTELSDGGLGAISLFGSTKLIAFQKKWFNLGWMTIVEDSVYDKIVSRLCKSVVSLTYLASKYMEKVEAFRSDFW